VATTSLVIRTASFGTPKRVVAGVGALFLVGGLVATVTADALVGGVLALVGAGAVFGVALSLLRGPAVRFNRRKRTIDRAGGPKPGQIGDFNDFLGVEVVGMVDEAALEGTSLDDLHKTYPGKGLIKYVVCLVPLEGEPVPLLEARSKKHAVSVQQEIVKFVGWTHQSTTIPDSKRLLS
jgi:hypothetical protein